MALRCTLVQAMEDADRVRKTILVRVLILIAIVDAAQGEGDDVKLENPIPLVILAFHVEYWDYLGWKDPFASSAWTLKQRAYGQALEQDRIYTPEVVVQGRSHCIASNASSIVSLIQSADRFPAPDVQVRFLSSNLVLCSIAQVEVSSPDFRVYCNSTSFDS